VTTREGTGEVLDPDDVVAVAEATAARVSRVLPEVLTAMRHDVPQSSRKDGP
jgi:hypothetical protein